MHGARCTVGWGELELLKCAKCEFVKRGEAFMCVYTKNGSVEVLGLGHHSTTRVYCLGKNRGDFISLLLFLRTV